MEKKLLKAIDNNFNTMMTELKIMVNVDTNSEYTELEVLKALKEYLKEGG